MCLAACSIWVGSEQFTSPASKLNKQARADDQGISHSILQLAASWPAGLHVCLLMAVNLLAACCCLGTANRVLPQVYATNGQDHWLLGLQLIFKAYKEPVITHVDKAADSTVTVAIATQGLQDKYCSADPARRAELQRSMEAAAFKFAQVCGLLSSHELSLFGCRCSEKCRCVSLTNQGCSLHIHVVK
jgi:hypothetical protein